MYGSGAATGMPLIITAKAQAVIPKTPLLLPTACCAVAVGATMRRAAGRLTAATTPPAIATTTAASALYSSHSFGSYANLVCLFELKKKKEVKAAYW